VTHYEQIGTGYSDQRHADPRIERQIRHALGSARTVVNVGAGAGNYEPTDREVVAVEPSEVMIAQRSSTAAPVVRGVAELLPFPDLAFDCALASLTVHHWSDVEQGLRELRRVASRQVLFTFDVDRQRDLWFTADYLPESARLEEGRAPRMGRVLASLSAPRVIAVPIPHDCTDGFCGAYWRRPDAYLDATVTRSISSVAMLSNETVQRAVECLRRDRQSGEWDRRHGHLFGLEQLDLGYCLVVAGT
jgi:SAM-dependent methyltransferase